MISGADSLPACCFPMVRLAKSVSFLKVKIIFLMPIFPYFPSSWFISKCRIVDNPLLLAKVLVASEMSCWKNTCSYKSHRLLIRESLQKCDFFENFAKQGRDWSVHIFREFPTYSVILWYYNQRKKFLTFLLRVPEVGHCSQRNYFLCGWIHIVKIKCHHTDLCRA